MNDIDLVKYLVEKGVGTTFWCIRICDQFWKRKLGNDKIVDEGYECSLGMETFGTNV